MTRGRKPKPTSQKKLAGNPGKRKLNKREPKPAISADMKIDTIGPVAKAFSERYRPILMKAEILTDADAAAFELMAGHFSVALNALKQLQKSGPTLVTPQGLKKHPLTQVFRDNSTAFRSYATEFGMTPSSRSRLEVGEGEGESEEEKEERRLAGKVFGNREVVVVGEPHDGK